MLATENDQLTALLNSRGFRVKVHKSVNRGGPGNNRHLKIAFLIFWNCKLST